MLSATRLLAVKQALRVAVPLPPRTPAIQDKRGRDGDQRTVVLPALSLLQKSHVTWADD